MAVELALTNAQKLELLPTRECAAQSPTCCNGTSAGIPGTALGLAQISVGQVWHGQKWFDATVRLGPAAEQDVVLLTADFGNQTDIYGMGLSPVWQVRFALGAFPSCAIVNENKIPLAPFGQVAVSPACAFAKQ